MTPIHVRFEGQSHDFQADLGSRPTDAQVRQAAANFIEVDVSKLTNYVVDRPENGSLILRPEAVYG